jgi:hypothetical protein
MTAVLDAAREIKQAGQVSFLDKSVTTDVLELMQT